MRVANKATPLRSRDCWREDERHPGGRFNDGEHRSAPGLHRENTDIALTRPLRAHYRRTDGMCVATARSCAPDALDRDETRRVASCCDGDNAPMPRCDAARHLACIVHRSVGEHLIRAPALNVCKRRPSVARELYHSEQRDEVGWHSLTENGSYVCVRRHGAPSSLRPRRAGNEGEAVDAREGCPQPRTCWPREKYCSSLAMNLSKTRR